MRFHHVIKLGSTTPWLSDKQQECKRNECKERGRPPPKETLAHFLRECPPAVALWEGVAKLLCWPDLAKQHWETIASGREPQGGMSGPKIPPRPGTGRQHQDKRWTVPWSVVRLVNLYVTLALSIQRSKELKDRKPPRDKEWVEFVRDRLLNVAKYNETRMNRTKWEKQWAWLKGWDTPIT